MRAEQDIKKCEKKVTSNEEEVESKDEDEDEYEYDDEDETRYLNTEFVKSFKVVDRMVQSISRFNMAKTDGFGEFSERRKTINRCIVDVNEAQKNAANIRAGAAEKKKTVIVSTTITTEKNNVSCKKCYKICHSSCDCLLAYYCGWTYFCTEVNGKKCKNCGHSSSDHESGNYYYVCEERPTRELEQEIALHEQNKNNKMLQEIKTLQVRGSFFFYNSTMSNILDEIKNKIKQIHNFDQKKITAEKMLDDINRISQDPFCSNEELMDAKIRWFCGVLELVDNSVTQEDIDRAYEDLSTESPIEKDKTKYQFAKDFLLGQPGGISRIQQAMPICTK